ncbi:L-threonate dehydrogenase [Rhizobium indigoferae]|uniref:L-threonate dehydrogenase n=1 Tax=Rhizobium indigoferae TaxID=158891 RepID=A0ABZ0ZFU7_9HYPH|nr:L-threonate dehydrogenase [Rhizobium indigoferae]NNU56169.1 NAD(P)-dependent oxidoreductase [Rhizobium indigoferae]WQN37712.1 NAD(P)-dependent oxidoreductase [Rhizobium indigoferae]GLR59302.1 3-hydroxyisobutyrate dehydrogenase [Rhizobium indigoferae]
MKVGVFGLGSMGYGMASSLVRAGHEVFGADVNHEAVKRLHANGGSTTELGAAARELDAVVVVVLNSAQTEEVLFGKDGIVSMLSPGAVVIMCVTVAPEYARKAAERCSALGIHFLDAPISGGSVKAANGKLSIMASGTPEAFSRARPALDAMAEKVFELGDAAGAGSAMKAVNQMLAGTHIAAMAEAITFGITQGIDPETFLKVIPQCAGTSWMLENRAPHVAAGDYTPHSAIDIWPKDLGIVLDVARASKFSAPITAAALQQFVAASGMGLGREDDAAVAKIYARNAGIELPGVKS